MTPACRYSYGLGGTSNVDIGVTETNVTHAFGTCFDADWHSRGTLLICIGYSSGV